MPPRPSRGTVPGSSRTAYRKRRVAHHLDRSPASCHKNSAMPPRATFFVALCAAVSVAACGKSGSRETRPIEVIYRAGGPAGALFRVADMERPDCVGTGIRSANTDIQFGDRVFTAPHFFILENSVQPVSATFEVPPDELDAVAVDLFLGLDLRDTLTVIPGACGVIGTGEPTPEVPGQHRVRVEVCGFATKPPSDVVCGDLPDAFVGFTATIGDSKGTNVTSCSIRPVAESCRTPATLFLADPQVTVSAVIGKLSGENKDAYQRVELYIDDRLVDSQSGRGDVVVSHDL